MGALKIRVHVLIRSLDKLFIRYLFGFMIMLIDHFSKSTRMKLNIRNGFEIAIPYFIARFIKYRVVRILKATKRTSLTWDCVLGLSSCPEHVTLPKTILSFTHTIPFVKSAGLMISTKNQQKFSRKLLPNMKSPSNGKIDFLKSFQLF